MDIKELLNEYEALEINADDLKKEIEDAKAEKVKFADGHKKYWKEIKGKKLGESLNEGYKNFQRTLDDYDGSVMTITANNGYWVIAEISGCEGKTDKELDELADEVLTEKGLIKGDYFTAETAEEAEKNICESLNEELKYANKVEKLKEKGFSINRLSDSSIEISKEGKSGQEIYDELKEIGLEGNKINPSNVILENYTGFEIPADYKERYKIGCKYLASVADVEPEYYEIVEDNYEYPFGLVLIEYADLEHKEEIDHTCIDLYGEDYPFGMEVNEAVNEAKLDWQYVGDDSLKSKIDWLYHHNVNYNKKQYYAIDDIRDYLKGIKELSDEDIEDLIFLLQHNNKNYRGDQETIINELELNAIKKAVNESVNEAEKKYLTKAELVAKIKEGILPDEYEPSDIGQGMGYKINLRWDEIPSDDIVIYIPEYGYGMWDDQDSMPKEDSIYTKADFREITKELGKRAEEEAEYLFQAVDWQHPESLWDEMDVDDEMDESISLAKRTLTKFSGIREDYDASTFQFCIRGGDIKLLDRLIDEKIAEYDKADKAGRHEIALAVEDMLRRLASSGENELPNVEFNRLYDKLAALDDRIIEDNTAEMKKAEKEVRASLIKEEKIDELDTTTIRSALYKQAEKGVDAYNNDEDEEAWYNWREKFGKNRSNYKKIFADALKKKDKFEKEEFLKAYRKNEDGNYHFENLVLTAEFVEDEELIKATKALLRKIQKQGHYSMSDEIGRRKMQLEYILEPVFYSVYDDLHKNESVNEEEKREVLPIKFIGVDEWNRPAFKPEGKKYFLTDINNLFSEGATEEEVKKFYADAVEKGTALRDLITYHGYSLDDDPMGSKLKFDLEIV